MSEEKERTASLGYRVIDNEIFVSAGDLLKIIETYKKEVAEYPEDLAELLIKMYLNNISLGEQGLPFEGKITKGKRK